MPRFRAFAAAGVTAALFAAAALLPHEAAAQSSKMAEAEALLKSHRVMPAFTAPGPAFDAKKCMAGKKILSIPLTMTNPFNVQVEKGFAAAAKDVGVPYTTWDNQLRVDQWVQGIAAGINQKVALINLQGGINPEFLAPQIGEAHAAGIKIMTTHLYDITQKPAPITDANARLDYSMAGKLMAAWAYSHTKGKPNVVIMGSDDIVPTSAFVKAIQDQLHEYCPTCKQRYINVPAAEWATKIQPSIQSALIADPGVNFILPIYDSMSQFIIPALRLTGRKGSVGIASYNGTPFVLDMVRNGDVEMDVGESLGWVGYASLDVAMRYLCGLKQVQDLNTPLYIFDKSNAATAGVPANFNDGYGNTHVAGFRKLWMLD